MTKKYSSSLTNAQWQVIENKLPEQMIKHKRHWSLRSIFEAILYVLKNGCNWRDIPGDFPPSVGIIDAQSVKATAISAQSNTGYDAGKKVKGRKRHIMVDTLGLMITVWVSAAHWQDRTAAYWLFVKLFINRVDFPRLFVFFADGGYIGRLVHFVKNQFKKLNWQLHIVKKDENIKTFKVLPKR